MSPRDLARKLLTHSFPRVSGDEPLDKGHLPLTVRFSPRERG